MIGWLSGWLDGWLVVFDWGCWVYRQGQALGRKSDSWLEWEAECTACTYMQCRWFGLVGPPAGVRPSA